LFTPALREAWCEQRVEKGVGKGAKVYVHVSGCVVKRDRGVGLEEIGWEGRREEVEVRA